MEFRRLGHGGMAEVNLAVMSGKGNFRKLVVIKRMHAHREAEPGFVDMFLDEARLAAQHSSIIRTASPRSRSARRTTRTN